LVAKKSKSHKHTTDNRSAIIITLAIVALRGIYSPIEVLGVRHSSVSFFNLLTTIIVIPVMLGLVATKNKSSKLRKFDFGIGYSDFRKYFLFLAFIGLTFAINSTLSIQAKQLAPVAGYVTTIKSTQALPMMLVGHYIFKEKIVNRQWIGLLLILLGLVCFVL
jgi:drug/metabolite transporter (DMT)-like permease